jgi:hypothetical protein
MSDMSLFESAAPYQKHSKTSKEAAAVIGGKSLHQGEKVLSYLKRYGPSTDDEIAEALSFPCLHCGVVADKSSWRRARAVLKKEGLVVDTGKTRPGRSGRRQSVWSAK